HNQMEWPTAPAGGSRHTGSMQVHPPEGVTLATAELPPGAAQRVASRAGQQPDLTTTEFQVGGALDYVFEGDAIELTSGYIATPSTHVTFDGRTGRDTQTRIPFRATSSDWQEGYRLMTAVMTAVGSPTEPFEVDGAGTFEGVMLGDLARPRVEATFAGEALHAWNVEWGVGGGGVVVENGYLEVRNGLFRNDGAEFGADGTFSIGGSDVDGGEDINAVITMVSFPTSNIRSAFGLEDGYTIDGPATGEVRLYGPYRAMFGYGQVVLEQPIAYGEPIDSASSGLRFEGNGVRLDGFEMRKGAGTVTGAAFIGWDASYVFNWDVRDLEVNTVTSMPAPPEPLSGVVNFNIAGVGAFDDPRYEIRGNVVDLFLGDEEIGQVTARLSVRDDLLTVNLEGASSTLAVSAAGQVEMTDMLADLRVRVANASLAPYVRMFDPRLSPYTSAVVSGSAHIQGPLQADSVRIDATIEQADLTLLDYDLHNDGPIQLRLNGQAIGIDQLRLVGEGTALDLSGSVDLATDALGLDIDGDANLSILRGLVPDLRGSGVAQVRTRVTGTFAQPELAGQAALLNGRIRHIGLPHGLEAINGRVLFEEGGLRFDDVPAVMGGGTVTIGGRVGLDGVDLQELAITLTGREMQWRYPVGFRSLVDANLVLRGAAASPVLAGTIDVRDANLLDGLDLGTGLFSGGEDELEVEVPESDASVLPLALDIRVVAPSSLRMTSNAVRVVASADLTVQGTYDQP
ncbi:MAG: translocation/assembly module TamB domain-containing protein, partial [Vicinamibacterales bacterium]|nr:translocation/assembly module TamB domain-containing protein [Vicinamibacterales bacterium]